MLVLFDFDPKINNHIHIWSDLKLKDYEISSTLIKILDFFRRTTSKAAKLKYITFDV